MTSTNFAIIALGLLMVGCSENSPGPSLTGTANTSNPTNTVVAGDNVMAVTVNGSLCGDPQYQYANQPCTSVTICQPGTTNCQVINNILLDTGSYGLRLFASVISVPLTPQTNGAATIAECVQYGDGTSQWGPVDFADVKLGNEPAVRVPILTVNATYATPPSACTTSQSIPDTSPQEAGYNGILGVGLLASDCGDYCQTYVNNGQYFACTGTSCSGASVTTGNQVQNPVALLPADNNGVILQLPAVNVGGSNSATGSLILGIGTRSNNVPSGVTTFSADSNAEFSAEFSAYSSSSIPSFIDSGTNEWVLPPPTGNQLPDCNSSQGRSHGSQYAGIFCPASLQSFSSTMISASGSQTESVNFQIDNGFNLFNSAFSVFGNLGDSSGTGVNAAFVWGLPFFLGRSVYVGIDQTSSSLGTGPYWAY